MDSGASSSESVILSYEETIGDTSESDIDVRPK